MDIVLCCHFHYRNFQSLKTCHNDCGFSPSSPNIFLKSVVVTFVLRLLTNQPNWILGADSHCFSVLQFPLHCFTFPWPQSRVCHYKVLQVSIHYTHPHNNTNWLATRYHNVYTRHYALITRELYTCWPWNGFQRGFTILTFHRVSNDIALTVLNPASLRALIHYFIYILSNMSKNSLIR